MWDTKNKIKVKSMCTRDENIRKLLREGIDRGRKTRLGEVNPRGGLSRSLFTSNDKFSMLSHAFINPTILYVVRLKKVASIGV